MRDAFGSTFMMRLIIIFIVFYVTFATIAVSYAKTYRIKNSLINYIEQYQLSFSPNLNEKNSSVNSKVNDFLKKNKYERYNDSIVRACNNSGGRLSDPENKGGACIQALALKNNHYYYRVTLYMIIHIPAINYEVVFPVSGETEDYSRNYNVNVH